VSVTASNTTSAVRTGAPAAGPARVTRRLSVLAVTISLAALSLAPAAQAAGGPPPPPGGPTFSHTVFSQVTVGGSGARPGGSGTRSFVPAPCWLEPRFTGANSFHPGDPQEPLSATFDADTYWWWFAQQEGLTFALDHIPDARQEINQDFKDEQGKSGWWWVPSWVNDSAGFACAQSLVDTMNLNNGFLDFAPPVLAGPDTPGHTIDPTILADLARAVLRLPTIQLHSSPPAGKGDVNLPMWVWATTSGPTTDFAEVGPLPDGTRLRTTVTATDPRLTISASAPGGQVQVVSRCGQAPGGLGTPYHGQSGQSPTCGVTFLTPSLGGGYTLTATVRWTVTWTANIGEPQQGTFTSPPFPLPQRSLTQQVTVREVQAINGG
jgi:hypothetical protein